MPFKSAKQKRWMYANKPEMARRWSAEEKVSKMLEMPNGAIAKSYIPKTGKFVPATQAGKGTLRRAAKDRKKTAEWIAGGKSKLPPTTRQLKDEIRDTKIRLGSEQSAVELKNWGRPVSSQRVNGRKVFFYEREGIGGETIRVGGRKGQSHVRVGVNDTQDSTRLTLAHEMVHARTRRASHSTYTMNRRQRGGEEGRADALSRGADYRVSGSQGGNPAGSWYHRAATTPASDPSRVAQGPATLFASGRKWRAGYRNSQDRVYGAQQPNRSTNRVRNRMSVGGKVIYGGAGGTAAYQGDKRYRREANGRFARGPVSKMSPDPSALHVPGARGKLTRVNRTPKKRTAGMG